MAKNRRALKKRNKINKKLPTEIANNIQQALQYQQLGYLNEAELIYKSVLKQYPEQVDCLHFSGMLHHQRSNNDLAVAFIEKSINIDKENPIYYNNYGLVLEKLNRLEQARTAYQKAIKYKADYAEAWFNLALIYSREFDYKSAEEAYQNAIRIKPDYIKALYNLASVQELQSKQDAADDTINKILKISPDSAEVHNTLGSVFFKLSGADNFIKAEKHFWKAIELKPDYLAAYINLGLLHEEGNNIENAAKCYEKVLELEPEHPEAKLNLALVLVKAERTEKSEYYLSQILETSPKNTKALTGLGNIKLTQGRFIEAEKIFKGVININSEAYDAYFGLTQCKKIDLEDHREFINELNSRANKYKNSYLYFALGKSNDDIGYYDKAFSAYKKGNDIKNKKINYDRAKSAKKTNAIINLFTKEFINKLSANGNQTELPVFIIGSPRSGTTLTEQIISSHPLVYGAGELTYIKDQLKQISINCGTRTSAFYGIEYLKSEDIAYYANEYTEKIKNLSENDNIIRITDKMPGNFLYIGYILSILPNAKIIHCKRNPLDTCLSIYFQLFHSSHEYSFGLENLGHWYKDYLRIMDHWNELFGDKIMTIEYDETINNFKETVEKLLDYCGLKWDEQCIKFYETNREVKTASQWQVRQPIYKSSSERWKKYDKHIGTLKEILHGYY